MASKNKKRIINLRELGEPLGPYSHIVVTPPGRMVFLSGAAPLDEWGRVIGGKDAGLQAEKAMQNLKLMLKAAGATLRDVMKTTVYLTNLKDAPKVAAVRRAYFRKEFPPSTLVVIKSLAIPDMLVEIDAWAVVS